MKPTPAPSTRPPGRSSRSSATPSPAVSAPPGRPSLAPLLAAIRSSTGADESLASDPKATPRGRGNRDAAEPSAALPAITGRDLLARLWIIHHLLLENRPKAPTYKDFADAVEISPRSVRRDVDTMRHTLCLPIQRCPRGGFRYTRRNVAFAAAAISSGEFLALHVAARMLGAHAEAAGLGEGVRRALRKVRLDLRSPRPLDFGRLDQALFVHAPGGAEHPDPDLIPFLLMAALAGEEARFSYEGLEDRAPRERTAEPLYVACIAETWYLRARDVRTGKRRTFCLDRMTDARPTGCRFVPLPRAEAEADFAHSLGAFGGRPPVRVVLRLRGVAARKAKERPWHSSQRLRALGAREIELELRVSDTPDLLQKLLGWGQDAEVLKPASLRQKVLAHAQAIAARG